MPLQHSCFISYRHPTEPKSPVRYLTDALITEIGSSLQWQACFDRNRLKPGYVLDPALASGLYSSACMVVIYTGHYFRPESSYCSREFFGMLDIERSRRALFPADKRDTSLIIPVAFREFNRMNEQIRNAEQAFYGAPVSPRLGVNLEGLSGPLTRSQRTIITNLVSQMLEICDLHERLGLSGVDLFPNQQNFTLPADAVVRQWIPAPPGWQQLPNRLAA